MNPNNGQQNPTNGRNPLPAPLPDLPSWETIEQALCIAGDPAYRETLRIIVEWVHEHHASIADLERRLDQYEAERHTLPGSIPDRDVTYVPNRGPLSTGGERDANATA